LPTQSEDEVDQDEVDVTMKLAAPDVVSFERRRPGPAGTGTWRCPSPPEDPRRHLEGLPRSTRLPADDSSSRTGTNTSSSADFDAMCRSVAIDPDTRLVQSAITGDWRFVTDTSSTVCPQVRGDIESSGSRSGPRRRRYVNMRPTDMGVGGLSSDLSPSATVIDVPVPTSSAYQLDLSSRTGGTVLPTSELVDSSPEAYRSVTDAVLSLPSSVSTSAKYSQNVAGKGEAPLDNRLSVGFGEFGPGLVKNYAPEHSPDSAVFSPSSGELVSPLPRLHETAADAIQTSPSGVRSSSSVVLISSDILQKDKASLEDSEVRTSQDDDVHAATGHRCGMNNVDVVKSCTLSTQFATDADLEADLLSSKLLREFREAIKSAVDSISADRSHPGDDDLPLYTVPHSNFASAQSFLAVERVQKFSDSFESSPASVVTSLSSHNLSNNRVESCSETSYRQFRLSNIPTLNGVNHCRRSTVRDDLTTVTHKSAVTQNVLRHRRSLPDTNQLRTLSSATSSRDAALPSRSNVRTRSSLVVGGCSQCWLD